MYLDKKIKESGVDPFGESVASVHSLLFVQSDVNLVWLATPFAVEQSARQLWVEVLGVDFKQIRWKLQTCKVKRDYTGCQISL